MADATADSGWLDTGTKFLAGVTAAYGTYERAKTANDIEYPSYDNYGPAPTGAQSVPPWVWIVGGVGVLALVVKLVR